MQNKLLVHNDEVRKEMLDAIGLASTDELFKNIDAGIRLREDLDLPKGLSEIEAREKLLSLSKMNATTSDYAYFIGGGSYNKYSPACISYLTQRSEFLTAYTPYQPEISQGSLQSIYEYQTMICNITGMDLSNAGVYDGASACAESLLMSCRIKKKSKVLVASTINPEYLKVILTYAHAGNIEVDIIPANKTVLNIKSLEEIEEKDYASVLVQYPNYFGDIEDMEKISTITKNLDALFVVSADPSALAVLKQPSKYDADIVCGDIQTLGLPMVANAGYMATKTAYMRQIPGRIVGATVDRDGKTAYTLTQQAREQHIRRDKATSNICSNQALLTLSATIYLSYMGFDGLLELEENAIQKAQLLAKKFAEIQGFEVLNKNYLNEFVVKFPDNIKVDDFLKQAELKNIFAGINLETNFNNMRNCLLVSLTELNTLDEIYKYISLLKENI
ncbi:MAG: aminomethyl-transferring glycine dehydrogenase subunit GcvPA [Candidatus Gastranaerophilales bacterium]|nr:aminomethyl-transferring glycine dehydrogenase subunit GcvPA [Candidatus Gastranaerophilales bacterium]